MLLTHIAKEHDTHRQRHECSCQSSVNAQECEVLTEAIEDCKQDLTSLQLVATAQVHLHPHMRASTGSKPLHNHAYLIRKPRCDV